jgi:signal transduction histidine kinase/ActR/RegA family two-component response regulator
MAFPTPIFDDTGTLTGGVNVLVDISDHRDAEARQARLIEELERSRVDMAEALQAAEAANQAKSAFLANMSHELRTPLNGVMGVAGALYLADIAPQHREMAKLISESAKTLEDILSDILDWSKFEAGKLTIEALDFAPDQALSPVIELMKLRALEKGLTFDVAFTGPAESMVVGDPLRIKQVIANLLSNAVKFTLSGGIKVTVSALDDPHDVTLQILSIAVEDTGVGFGEAARERLFDRFEQADASFTRRYGGTGLGLAIALGLVRLMGGEIDVISTAGIGSRFTVTLPLRKSHMVIPAQPAASVDILPLPIKVLLAEDHPTNQKVVTMILEPLGASVTVVDDGIKALDAFMTDGFDLIIMDMQMPEMDGLTAIGRIRELERTRGLPRTPIAVLSANASDEHRATATRAGADGYIAKPVTPHSLISGITEAMEASERPDADDRPKIIAPSPP